MNLDCHQLRRIGLPASIKNVKNVYRISVDTTMIGRSGSSDIFLDSAIRKGLISRAHAQIIKKQTGCQEIFEIFDTSLNGTYVNDVRVKGSVVLKDRDKIAFGHLQGSLIEPGVFAPQKETEFLFKFEKRKIDDNFDIKEEMVDLTDSNKDKGQEFDPLSSPNNGLDNKINDIVSQLCANEELSQDLEVQDTVKAFKSPKKSPIPPPSHPRSKLHSNSTTLAYESSSDSDIKIDTSLNVKHLKKKMQKPPAKARKKIIEECTEESYADEYYSDQSEEITDVDDEEYFYSPSKTRTRNIKSPAKLEVSDQKKTSKKKKAGTSTQKRGRKRKKSTNGEKKSTSGDENDEEYVHDACASWNCKRPSGALKTVTWVQCDDCDAWYHLVCSGLTNKDVQNDDTNFHCGC